jgi:hypothetical protein
MERKAARTSGHHRSLVVLAVVIVLIAAAAVAVGSSADLRRAVGWTRIHPGYQWLHSGLDQASASAELALTGSRRQAVRSAAEVLRSAILYSRANVRRGRAEPIPDVVKKRFWPRSSRATHCKQCVGRSPAIGSISARQWLHGTAAREEPSP